MATTIRRYEEVKSNGVNLVNCASKMADAFAEIQNQTNKINSGEGIFDGTAAAEIKTTVSAFTSQLTEFSDAVKSCGEFIQSVANAYQTASAQAQNAINGGGNSAPGRNANETYYNN